LIDNGENLAYQSLDAMTVAKIVRIRKGVEQLDFILYHAEKGYWSFGWGDERTLAEIVDYQATKTNTRHG
jgi:hypothetical protein